jgi:hypothetical protein
MSRAPSDFFRPFGKLPGHRRLLIALLAVVTALGILLALLVRPGGVQRPLPPPQADVATCRAGQTEACVGSTTLVITPATPPAK